MNFPSKRFDSAIAAFDNYNAKDPNLEEYNGKSFPKEVLYAQRMTDRLNSFAPAAGEAVQLAVRCQHIGRWEIARSNYPMDKKGYLQWRSEEKMHHAQIAESILKDCGYDQESINYVKFLVLKKELFTNPDTQVVEDIVCLVFMGYYVEDFAIKHNGEKVIDIIRKTAKKMSPIALEDISQLLLSAKIRSLLQQAVSPTQLFRFEKSFMPDNLRCIPMTVRFKLDTCCIKLKITEWNFLNEDERTYLVNTPAKTEKEIAEYREYLQHIVWHYSGEKVSEQASEPNPAWANFEVIHDSVKAKAFEFGWNILLSEWHCLSDLQRFALLKLSRPSHENKNFSKAMEEFGLIRL